MPYIVKTKTELEQDIVCGILEAKKEPYVIGTYGVVYKSEYMTSRLIKALLVEDIYSEIIYFVCEHKKETIEECLSKCCFNCIDKDHFTRKWRYIR